MPKTYLGKYYRRIIIIPVGLFDPNDVNVIEIPAELHDEPIIVASPFFDINAKNKTKVPCKDKAVEVRNMNIAKGMSEDKVAEVRDDLSVESKDSEHLWITLQSTDNIDYSEYTSEEIIKTTFADSDSCELNSISDDLSDNKSINQNDEIDRILAYNDDIDMKIINAQYEIVTDKNNCTKSVNLEQMKNLFDGSDVSVIIYTTEQINQDLDVTTSSIMKAKTVNLESVNKGDSLISTNSSEISNTSVIRNIYVDNDSLQVRSLRELTSVVFDDVSSTSETYLNHSTINEHSNSVEDNINSNSLWRTAGLEQLSESNISADKLSVRQRGQTEFCAGKNSQHKETEENSNLSIECALLESIPEISENSTNRNGNASECDIINSRNNKDFVEQIVQTNSIKSLDSLKDTLKQDSNFKLEVYKSFKCIERYLSSISQGINSVNKNDVIADMQKLLNEIDQNEQKKLQTDLNEYQQTRRRLIAEHIDLSNSHFIRRS